MATHTYRACNIWRNSRANALRWQSYCNGRFLAADTLAGMRALIRAELEG